MRHKQAGFTLVELVVVAPMVMIAIAIILSYILSMFLVTGEKNAKILMQAEAQTALFTLRDDVMFANYFQGELPPGHSDPHKSGGWSAYYDNALMFTEAAYTANRQSQDRQLVYVSNTPNPCGDGSPEGNNYSVNTIILFVDDNTLYRRVIVPDQSGNCLATYRQQTCPETVANSDCPADSVIAQNVKEFNLEYYTNRRTWSGDSPDTPLPKSRFEAPERFLQVTRADIEVVLEKMISGEPVTTSARISIKRAE